MKHEVIKCKRCNKPVYPIELLNRDIKTWCGCEKIDIPDGWSGYVHKSKYEQRRQR